MAAPLGHDRVGTGPPLLLIHPLGADRHVWDQVAERLAPTREVISLDLPGFGTSQPLREEPTPAALAAAVAEFTDSLGVTRPDVAGNSLGGWVALELALAGHAASVTAIAPAGLWSRPLGQKRALARTLSRLGLPLVSTATATARGRRLLLAGSVARPELVGPAAAARLIRSYATAPDFTRVNAAMRSAMFTRLAEVEVPVTLVWPEFDGLVRRPRRLPPTVVSIDLPGAGHIPMLDQPDAVVAILERSAAGQDPGDRSSMLYRLSSPAKGVIDADV